MEPASSNSLKENAAAINAKGAAERKQADQIVDRTRQMTDTIDAAIDRMRREQLQADRSFADVDEGCCWPGPFVESSCVLFSSPWVDGVLVEDLG